MARPGGVKLDFAATLAVRELLAEVSGSAPLSRALDVQPAMHEYTSSADGPISPSHSMHSLYGPVKRSAMSDVVGPLCW